MLTACHEIGHCLIALIADIRIIHVTVRTGDDYVAHTTYDSTRRISRSDMFRVLLAGWSAEAYYVSHKRDATYFNEKAFFESISSTGAGVGRRLGILRWSGRDVARAMRIRPIKSFFREGTLLANARVIHERRATFFSMVDEILEEFELSGKRIRAIFDGESHTAETRRSNRRNELNAWLGLPFE